LEYLSKSKELGSKLIVGINSDSSVKRLKGDSRPFNCQEDRRFLLEGLKCVDEVIFFDEDTPYNLIKKIKPDIITKGGDYSIDQVVGNDICKVVILPYVKGYSTTKALNEACWSSR
jgi:D-beta-D-heptose 7-phosphate kinase/D-beta-D-heptose 1-phosphate adenosyltransferase